MRNVILYYYCLSHAIYCLLLIFGLISDIIVDDIKKLWTLKVLIIQPLKFSGNTFAIVFTNYYFGMNFQNNN